MISDARSGTKGGKSDRLGVFLGLFCFRLFFLKFYLSIFFMDHKRTVLLFRSGMLIAVFCFMFRLVVVFFMYLSFLGAFSQQYCVDPDSVRSP